MYISKILSNNIAQLISLKTPKSNVTVKGWIYNVQKHGKMYFVKVYDNSCSLTIQTVVPKKILNGMISNGSAIEIFGQWVKSLGKSQSMELLADSFTVIGHNKQPILENNNDLLRQKLNVRPKNQAFSAILKLRSHFQYLSHRYFVERGYTFIDTPMTSRNDCEGAGEVFVVESANNRNFFGEGKVFLPVSGQLHLEAMACALSNVYTIGPVFRADKSQTRQHLAEFRMLEVECSFVNTLENLCNIVEDFLKYIVAGISMQKNDLLVSKVLCDRIDSLLENFNLTQSIPRITYMDAIEFFKSKGEKNIQNLTKQHELMLVNKFNGPLFVLNYPANVKPFYMKRMKTNDNLAENFDLLAPFVGELAGGSLRESDYNTLKLRLLNNNDIKKEEKDLEWYLELRKSGYPNCGGFGLGVDRLMQALLGIENIKDTIPFPRWYKHCKC